MIKKIDWQTAYHELIAEGRRKLGEPPTLEELEAYSRGDLAGADLARVRRLLVYYPELANALDTPFPLPGDLTPGSIESLSDEELARDWAALQEKISSPPMDGLITPPAVEPAIAPPPHLSTGKVLRRREPWSRSLQVWRLSTVAAALVAVFLGGVLLRTQRELHEALTQPRTDLEHRLLLPDGQRGGTAEQPAIPLPAETKYFLLIPALIDEPQFPDYRLQIVAVSETPDRIAGNEVIWSGTGLHRRTDDTFEILVPRAFLKPGRYQLRLEGFDPKGWTNLATYPVRLAPD
jgi:hypothetical protein